MVQPIHYKRPRRINVVSVTLALMLAAAAYLAYQYLPIAFRKQEAYRVLEETGSRFVPRRNMYRADPTEVEHLRRRMENDLHNLGIHDPRMETWIELDAHQARFGVVYSDFIEWPYEVMPPTERVHELEHTVPME